MPWSTCSTPSWIRGSRSEAEPNEASSEEPRLSTAVGVSSDRMQVKTRGGSLSMLRATGIAGIASAVVIAVATVLAVFGPLVAPYNPDLPSLGQAFIGPSGGHILGYDFEGRDVLSRLLAGAQSSMVGPLAVDHRGLRAGKQQIGRA